MVPRRRKKGPSVGLSRTQLVGSGSCTLSYPAVEKNKENGARLGQCGLVALTVNP